MIVLRVRSVLGQEHVNVGRFFRANECLRRHVSV